MATKATMAKGDDQDFPFLQLVNLPLSYHAGATTSTAAPTDRAKRLRWSWQSQGNEGADSVAMEE